MRQLLVNIDHVATLRNARGEGYPDPAKAAKVCEKAGAAGIVFHLRGDRRHIRDEDVHRLKETVNGLLDFEMAATDEMIELCLDIEPDLVTLVPENRQELTTEGGLDMAKFQKDFRNRVLPSFRDTPTDISLFLDPVTEYIEIAADLGVPVIELHTGQYANAASPEERSSELDRLKAAAETIHNLGMRVNAGHGLNLDNLPDFLRTVPWLQDVSIGHALISDALFMGLEQAVKAYIATMNHPGNQQKDPSGPEAR